MLKPKVGSYAVYEPTEEGWQDLNQQFLQVNADLSRAGLEVVEAPGPICDEGSCCRVAAWFTAQDIDGACPDHYLVGYPAGSRGTGGHPHHPRHPHRINRGRTTARLHPGDLEVEHRLFYGELGNLETSQEISVYAQACGLQGRLKGARFLMLGRRTPGMTPIAVDEVEIIRLFGALLVQMGMDEFADLAAKVSAGRQKLSGKMSPPGPRRAVSGAISRHRSRL